MLQFCFPSFSHFYFVGSPRKGLKVMRLGPGTFHTSHSWFTWKAVESIFILQNASLFGRLQLTFGFPNQLYHPDHLWQVPGQRPLLAHRPAAQAGGQHTFWGRPPSAQLCRVEIALEHRHSALVSRRGGRAAAAAATRGEILLRQGKANPRKILSSFGKASLLQPGKALSLQSLHKHWRWERLTSQGFSVVRTVPVLLP